MPSLAAGLPPYPPSKFNETFSTGPAQRQAESAEAKLWIALNALKDYPISYAGLLVGVIRESLAVAKTATDIMDAAPTSYPAFVVSTEGKAAYAAAIAALQVAVDAAVVTIEDVQRLY